jgi:RNA polymerase sigma-70 factor (ECF subfamily)
MIPPTPDDDLLAAQGGDRPALARLIQAHRHGVYRYGLQVCRTTEDAEDALQETLWAATRAIHTFRGAASSILSWMFTIIRRECYRLVERHRETPLQFEALDNRSNDGLGPDETLDERRRTELLSDALAALDSLHREVILLRDVAELSAPEAAARVGISVQALKSRLHRARVRLREQVAARGHAAERRPNSSLGSCEYPDAAGTHEERTQ